MTNEVDENMLFQNECVSQCVMHNAVYALKKVQVLQEIFFKLKAQSEHV